MRFALFFVLLSGSFALCADSWQGFCTVEVANKRICSEAQPRRGDFSAICNAFARSENAHSWRAQFSTSMDQLKMMMADSCDVVRNGQSGQMFACMVSAFCPSMGQAETSHLASRVYAANQSEAIELCYEKEDWRYQRMLKEQSKIGCFARIAVDLMPNN